MKTLIMAGGVGSRLSEETTVRPKPMVEIGHRPILWHIMKHYASFGFREFVIALGYKGDHIKRYMHDYLSLSSDVTFDFARNEVVSHDADRAEQPENWLVTLADTGQHTETGGRLLKAAKYLDGTFMMTYGDGVANIDLRALVTFHKSHGKLATVTAVHPTARFGHMEIDGSTVTKFIEKPQMEQGWVNGGFFVLEPGVIDFVPGDCDWSRVPMERLAEAGELAAFRHEGFWQCMDTLRDKIYLQQLWDSGHAPWKTWR